MALASFVDVVLTENHPFSKPREFKSLNFTLHLSLSQVSPVVPLTDNGQMCQKVSKGSQIVRPV
jgi:hypothetical protein